MKKRFFEHSCDFYYNCFKEYAEILASDYTEQLKILPINYVENLPLDIASDWDWIKNKYVIEEALENKFFDEKIVSMIMKISDKFIEAGYGGITLDETIWTLDGMKNHQFWKQQRILAKTLLNLLNTDHD